MVAASTDAHEPERLGFRMPAPSETVRSSVAQCRGGFRKKVSDPPPPMVENEGVCEYVGKNLLPRIASPVAPRRFGPSQESDTGALCIATSQIDATAACTYIGRIASDGHGGACSGPSA